ncbi:MAG: MmcQ/YjbR family DNA-binding protein [Tannerellaceae bacterium]|nr:MmcQ/YjbR family DNA-binding protein [Tannerellaceae bacterium]
MNIEELRTHCLSVKGATESFPFGSFGANSILVFKVMDKMFAYIDLTPKDLVFRVWMKCDPERAVHLREKYNGVIPYGRTTVAKAWNGVELESDVPDRLIQELVSHSADEVIKSLPKKKQEVYRQL